ncbi:MAG: hypothetical protein K2I08_07840 [Muribaculaceae bacterium]|nr:hypothetical protein [Muribaculaceae bacterium]
MGRKKVYAQEPGPENDEMPYDYWAFIRWCVNSQGLTEGTAKSYISQIRTAFTTMFDDEDTLFKDIRNAFLTHGDDPEQHILQLEDMYETLIAYTETIGEFADDWFDGYNSKFPEGKTKPVPKEDWVRAFQCYCRYIRWRIDEERLRNKMKVEVKDDSARFMEIPMRNQFRQYMKNKGKGYPTNTINTYCCKLKRLYNLLIRRVQNRNVFDNLNYWIERKTDINPFLDKLQQHIEYELEWENYPELSYDDIERGKNAFLIYREFLEDYAKNPKKYPREEYEIPRRENKNL